MYSKLQYISQGNTADEQLLNISEVLDAGCDWIQLRFKNASETDLKNVAGKVKLLCENYGAALIINDHVELVKEIDADGVHLGLDDMSVAQARSILGNTKIIGGTANTIDHVLKRVEEKCDYIGLGPFRFTSTKEKLSPVLGVEGFEKIMNELRKKDIIIPVYAIGGIILDDLPRGGPFGESIMDTGVYGIAVSGIIANNLDKRNIIEQLNNSLYANS